MEIDRASFKARINLRVNKTEKESDRLRGPREAKCVNRDNRAVIERLLQLTRFAVNREKYHRQRFHNEDTFAR